jgi:hypothetical protein
MNHPLRSLAAAVVIVGALAGCASISVQPTGESRQAEKPEKIYVATFHTARGTFNVDRDGADLRDFKHNLRVMLQMAMVTDLSKRLIPAEMAPVSEPQLDRHRAWLIRGSFIRVNQGSRLLRGAVGFGAGATKLETRVEVYDLDLSADKPFLTFTTTGGSNAEPGAVTGLWTDPVTAVVGVGLSGIGNFIHGVTEDTKRTSREITAVMSDYMFRRHWIDSDKWIHPKEVSPVLPPLPNSAAKK